MMKRVLTAFAASVLAACATTEVSSDRAKPVPATRVFVGRLVESDVAKAHVVVKRDEGVLGSATTLHLFANGEKVADIDVAEKIDLYLEPGRQVLAVQDWLGLAGMPTIAINCAAGETQVYRVSIPGTGAILLQPAAGLH